MPGFTLFFANLHVLAPERQTTFLSVLNFQYERSKMARWEMGGSRGWDSRWGVDVSGDRRL